MTNLLPAVQKVSEKIATEYQLPITEAQRIAAPFQTIAVQISEAETDLQKFGEPKEITPEVCAEAKRIRLLFRDIRTEGDKIHKKVKENVLLQSRAIDGIRNIFKLQIVERESGLEKTEKHFELIEAENQKRLEIERTEELKKYYFEDTSYLELGKMDEEVWKSFLFAKKTEFEKKIKDKEKADKEAEANRLRLVEIEKKNAKLLTDKNRAERKQRKAQEELDAKKLEDKRKADEIEAKRIADEKMRKNENYLKILAKHKVTDESRESREHHILVIEDNVLIYKLIANEKV